MTGDCLIIDFVRTPVCAMGKALSTRTVDQLEYACMDAIIKRTGLDPENLDHTICGHAHMDTNPYNLARTAWLLTRYSENVPGYTVHAGEASGLLAMEKAYYLHKTGNDLTALVGGAESYSRAPFILREARYHVDLTQYPVADSIREGECWSQPVPLDPRDISKKLAEKNGYSPEKLQSFEKAENARADHSIWDGHITETRWLDRKGKEVSVKQDDLPRPLDGFASYVDGAAAMLTTESDRAQELGLQPIGRIIGFSWAACEPDNRWECAIEAARKLTAKYREIRPGDVSDVEILADSAATTMAIAEGLEELGFPPDAVNPNGSSLTWGINEGADGVIAAGRCLQFLRSTGKRYGMILASAGGGESMAMLMEAFQQQ